jgi:argininosuccinate lyase
MALWGGRFEGGVDAFTQEFGASLEVDKNMAQQDIRGSIAHATMLAEQGVISDEDRVAIVDGLERIAEEIRNGSFVWDINDEDVHMAIERTLTERIGAAGGRLHTGRSRNDQVATDIRLLAKDLCAELLDGNHELRDALVDVAERNLDVVMPGYTHLQHAQPVLFSHHLLAYFWMFTRDATRL